jgi:hypothetical protein
MSAEVHPGGCERCGREDHVTYVHWQFLCPECRQVLAVEQEREHERALMASRVDQMLHAEHAALH